MGRGSRGASCSSRSAATTPPPCRVALGRRGARGLVTVDAHHDLRDGDLERLARAAADRGRAVGHSGRADRHRAARQLARVRASAPATSASRSSCATSCAAAHRRRHGRGARARRRAAGATGARRPRRRRVRPLGGAGVPGVRAGRHLRAANCAPPRALRGCIRDVVSIDLTEVDAAADAPDGRTVRLTALCVLEAVARPRS